MPVMAVARFERFFRATAGLDVDKDDLKRYSGFVDHKLYDLLIIARDTAKWNGRDVIEPPDIPITKGLQECMRDYRDLDEEIELTPILEQLATHPPLDIVLSEASEQRLVPTVGAISVALSRAFRMLDPEARNPTSVHWERAFRLFDLLL